VFAWFRVIGFDKSRSSMILEWREPALSSSQKTKTLHFFSSTVARLYSLQVIWKCFWCQNTKFLLEYKTFSLGQSDGRRPWAALSAERCLSRHHWVSRSRSLQSEVNKRFTKCDRDNMDGWFHSRANIETLLSFWENQGFIKWTMMTQCLAEVLEAPDCISVYFK